MSEAAAVEMFVNEKLKNIIPEKLGDYSEEVKEKVFESVKDKIINDFQLLVAEKIVVDAFIESSIQDISKMVGTLLDNYDEIKDSLEKKET